MNSKRIISMRYGICLSIIVLCLFNNQAILNIIGYPIDVNSSGGSPFKIMPSTYLIFILAALNIDKVLGTYKRSKRPVKIFFLSSISIFFIFSLLATSAGNVYLLNVLVTPAVFYLLLLSDKRDNLHFYFKVLITCFCINSITAFYEKVTLHIVFPPSQWEEFMISKDDGFRSSAFMGHPLNNALITSILTLFFFINISGWKKYIPAIIGIIGIMCFGARVALVCTLFSIIFYIVFSEREFKLKYIFIRGVKLVSLLAAIGFIMIIVLQNTTLGSRILEQGLTFNDSSSFTRFEIFNLFKYINFESLLIGVPQKEIEYGMYKIGMEAFENFWIIWLIKYGLFLFLLLSISFLSFLRSISKALPSIARFSLLFLFILVASSNNSLATSTAAVSIFVFCVLYTQKIFYKGYS